jgi:hypothetical protein
MKISDVNAVFDLDKDEVVAINSAGLVIKFTGASTSAMDNDDVISDAVFIVNYNSIETELVLETVNGAPGITEFAGYKFILEYADGYHQVCGLKVEKL